MSLINLEIPYFPDPTIGRPVYNGSIYVGEPDTDPEIVSNQKSISVLQEDGSEVPVSQPVLTGAGGVPLYNGSPVKIKVEGDYSLKVLNQTGVQVFYSPNSHLISDILSELTSAGLTKRYDTVAELKSIDLSAGLVVTTNGYYSIGDGGGAEYLIQTFADFGGTPDGYGDFLLANGNVASIQNGRFLEPFTVSVGPGQAYETLNAAIDHFGHIKPQAANAYGGKTGERADKQITLELVAGFTMQEQLHFVNLYLGHINITTAEPTGVVPVSRAALTQNFTARGLWDDYPLFGASGGVFPYMSAVVFEMDSSGPAEGRHGLVLREGARFFSNYNCGIRNAGEHGVYMSYQSVANVMDFDVSGAGGVGYYLRHDAHLHGRNDVRADDTVLYAVYAEQNSSFTVLGGFAADGLTTASSSAAHVRASSGSKIMIQGSSVVPDRADRLIAANTSSVILAEEGAEIILIGGLYAEGTSNTFSVVTAIGARVIAPDLIMDGTTEQRGLRAIEGGYIDNTNVTYGTKSVINATRDKFSTFVVDVPVEITLTATGIDGSPSGTGYYIVKNGVVVLTLPFISGTSNATTFSLTGLPTELDPSLQRTNLFVLCRDNNIQDISLAYVETNGTINLFYSPLASAWTASGVKRISGGTITYLL